MSVMRRENLDGGPMGAPPDCGGGGAPVGLGSPHAVNARAGRGVLSRKSSVLRGALRLPVFLSACLVIAAVFAADLARSEEEAKVVQEADKTVFKKKTVIDFSDLTIQGELTKPEGSYLLNRRRTSFQTLLKIRGNFLPELVTSIDSL